MNCSAHSNWKKTLIFLNFVFSSSSISRVGIFKIQPEPKLEDMIGLDLLRYVKTGRRVDT